MLGFDGIGELAIGDVGASGAILLERKDRVTDATSTTGTGTLTLSLAAADGFRTFAAHTDGALVHYCVINAARTEWEVGEGIWTVAGATLTRLLIYASSNSNNRVNFSAGSKTVSSVHAVTDMVAPISYRQDKLSVYLGTAANTTTAGWQKVPVDAVSYDTGGIWNRSTKRATPRAPGYYLVAVRSRTNATGALAVGVGVNGAIAQAAGSDATGMSGCGGSCLVYCNGTTDYVEAYLNTAAVRALTTGVLDTYLQIVGPIP